MSVAACITSLWSGVKRADKCSVVQPVVVRDVQWVNIKYNNSVDNFK